MSSHYVRVLQFYPKKVKEKPKLSVKESHEESVRTSDGREAI